VRLSFGNKSKYGWCSFSESRYDGSRALYFALLVSQPEAELREDPLKFCNVSELSVRAFFLYDKMLHNIKQRRRKCKDNVIL
jgi:hypothetical protein